jgi:hypothetical protein
VARFIVAFADDDVSTLVEPREALVRAKDLQINQNCSATALGEYSQAARFLNPPVASRRRRLQKVMSTEGHCACETNKDPVRHVVRDVYGNNVQAEPESLSPC